MLKLAFLFILISPVILFLLIKRLIKEVKKRKLKSLIKDDILTAGVLGKSYDMDVSEKALKERQKKYDLEELNMWQYKKPAISYVCDNGKPVFEPNRVTAPEREHVGFYGLKKYSKNKKYCVVFLSASSQDDKGYIALISVIEQKILYKKRVKRPHKCEVNNNGFVACNDWTGWKQLKTQFLIFDKKGDVYFSKMMNVGIGDICFINNEFAFFDTLVSDSKPSIDWKLFIVSLKEQKIIKKIDKAKLGDNIQDYIDNFRR